MTKHKLGMIATEERESYSGSKAGISVVGLEHLIPNEVTLSAWDHDNENTFTRAFKKGDVLFGRRRAYLHKAAVAPFDGICSGDITVIRAKSDVLVPELLPFIIQNDNFFDYAVEKSAGSLSPRVKWVHLKDYEFELPDLETQKRLADVLWSINDTIEAYKELISATDELVKARFVEMFGNKENTRTYCKYVELAELCRKENSRLAMKDLEQNEGIFPVYGAQGYISSIDHYEVDEDYVAIIKDGAGVGRACYYPAKSSIINTMQYLIPKRGVSVRFLESLLKLLDLGSECKGSTIPHIYFKNYSEKIVPWPDMEHQKLFSELVDQVDKSKEALQQSLNEARALQRKIIEENFMSKKED